MILVLFTAFFLTYFMPVLVIKGITLSDIFLILLLFYLLIKTKKINYFQKKVILIFTIFLILYIFESILHISFSLYNFSELFLVADKVAFIYFYVIIIIFILLINQIDVNKVTKSIQFSIIVNAIIVPYIYLFMHLGSYLKLTGLFVKPNQLAFFLILSPIILIIISYIKNNSFKSIYSINLFVFLLYIPMLATASKSGLITLVLIQLVIFIYAYNYMHKLKKSVFISFFIMAIISFNPLTFESSVKNLIEYFPQFSRVANFLFAEDIETQDTFRIINNREGKEIFFNNPLIGIGFGGDVFHTSTGHELHNTYIRLLACLGVLGTIMFFSLNIYFLYLSKKIIKSNIFIYLFSIIYIYGIYHDIFTSRYYYILFASLIYFILIKQRKVFR